MPHEKRIEILGSDPRFVNFDAGDNSLARPWEVDNPELAYQLGQLWCYQARFEAVAMHMMTTPLDSPERRTAERVMLYLVDGFLEAFPPDEEPGELGSLEWQGVP